MFTKKDKVFLLETFTTKDDLKAMEKRQDQKFATKDDLKAMEKRQDQKFATKDDLKEQLSKYATKDDLKQFGKEIVDDIKDYMRDNIIPLLNEHEVRIDRLEKRVGGFPPVKS